MSEIMSTNYLLIMRKDIENKIQTAERQNESFKKMGLYPDYNMDDIVEDLKEQLVSINKCIELADLDFADLYETSASENVILTEDLLSSEAQLKEDYEEQGIEEIINGQLSRENEQFFIIDGFIDSVEHNKANEYEKEVLKRLGISEKELENKDEKEI